MKAWMHCSLHCLSLAHSLTPHKQFLKKCSFAINISFLCNLRYEMWWKWLAQHSVCKYLNAPNWFTRLVNVYAGNNEQWISNETGCSARSEFWERPVNVGYGCVLPVTHLDLSAGNLEMGVTFLPSPRTQTGHESRQREPQSEEMWVDGVPAAVSHFVQR